MAEPIPVIVPPLPELKTPPAGDESGSSDMAFDLVNELSGAKPVVAPEPKPEPKPADPAPEPKPAEPKPEPKPTPAPAPKPAPVAPKPAPKAIDVDDPKVPAAELRKHLKQVQEDAKKTIGEKEAAASKLASRLAELEKKKYWSEEDVKENESKTKRLAQLESDLYGRDFTASPEYKKNFTDKINLQYADAVEVFKSLSVKTVADDGTESVRDATQADVMRLFNAPSGAERRKMAKQLFGEDYQEALDMVNPMVETQKAADLAVKEKTENYQSEIKQRAEAQTAEQGKIQSLVKQHTDALAEKLPDIFKPSETEPEKANLLRQGFDFIEESSSKQNMDINERASRIAAIRSMAAAFPVLRHMLDKVSARNTELEEEVAKYRDSDPANASGAGEGGGTPPKDGGGSDDFADELDKLQRGGK